MNVTQLWRRAPNAFGLALLALVLIVIPFWVQSSYLLSNGIFIGIAAILTLGLALLMGYAGQVSLGHAAFYAMGAYTSAILTVKFAYSPWLAMILGVLVTGTLAYLIGKIIFRLSGHYLALATLGLGIIVFLALGEFRDLTGGSSGLPGVPRQTIGSFAFDSDIKYYYLVWAVFLLLLAFSLNVVNSRIGRALRAIHVSEMAAESVGVDAGRFKLRVLVLSAVYASIAGSLYVHYMRFVSPQPFDFHASVRLVVMAAVGGLASVWGAPFGAAVVILLTALLRDILPLFIKNASGEHTVIVYGLILVLIMIFMPEGLTSGLLKRRRWPFFRLKK
ncbi:MAG TPA: branched-chain amino acid ABC transporter permease [Anaerolineae bacterium]|nr:branched-chain amino acid ABC transporter permease [Anaerolineae bacterium]HMR65333.1 branched-chain amino acid ABC transporter permease [Anaerolineae bacterium]